MRKAPPAGAQGLLTTWDTWVVVGKYEVYAPFDTPEPLPTRWGWIHGGESSGQCILSKDVYDFNGEEKRCNHNGGHRSLGPAGVDRRC